MTLGTTVRPTKVLGLKLFKALLEKPKIMGVGNFNRLHRRSGGYFKRIYSHLFIGNDKR